MNKIFLSMMVLLAVAAHTEAKTVKKEFIVNGSCGMCEKRIITAAKKVPGVIVATWNKRTKKMCLLFDDNKTSENTVMQALSKAGHDAGPFKASKKDYKSLPSCCWYRTTKIH